MHFKEGSGVSHSCISPELSLDRLAGAFGGLAIPPRPSLSPGGCLSRWTNKVLTAWDCSCSLGQIILPPKRQRPIHSDCAINCVSLY